ncbi:hypothetical protein T484DRAFT_1856747 [Baffinella frigidus]|nr:hypothetical protein T484DRAFT_1856747 [Cryptophyta sp. CCMP2293]
MPADLEMVRQAKATGRKRGRKEPSAEGASGRYAAVSRKRGRGEPKVTDGDVMGTDIALALAASPASLVCNISGFWETDVPLCHSDFRRLTNTSSPNPPVIPAGITTCAICHLTAGLAEECGWNTETSLRDPSNDITVLSTYTWINLYTYAVAGDTEKLHGYAQSIWDSLPSSPRRATWPKLAGILYLSELDIGGELGHFMAVHFELQSGEISASDAAKVCISSSDCSLCRSVPCKGGCEGDLKRQYLISIYNALVATREPDATPAGRPACSWDPVRRQIDPLDKNCGLYALHDLRALVEGSSLRCSPQLAAESRRWAQILLWTSGDCACTVMTAHGAIEAKPQDFRHLRAEVARRWEMVDGPPPGRREAAQADPVSVFFFVGSIGS